MEFINIVEWNKRIEKAFKDAKQKIPEYEQELKVIQEVLTKGLNIEEKLSLEKRQQELIQIIDDLLNDVSFGFYSIDVQTYLNDFISNVKPQTKISFMKKDRVYDSKAHDIAISFIELVSQYQKLIDIDLPSFNNPQAPKIECSCGNSKDIDIVDGRLYYCLKCGTQILENIGTKSTYKDIDRINPSSKYKYTRMIHFRNCVRQYQGKQKVRILPQVIRDVKEQLKINGIFKNINPQHIRVALQETGWTTQYENCILIWSQIVGKNCPDISHLETGLYSDFELIEREYNIVMEEMNENRTSFMSYPYVLYQLLIRHNCPGNINFFSMLKNDRLRWLDETMEKIYNKLEWGGFTPII